MDTDFQTGHAVGRLTHSLPLARFFNLPVYVARVPAAPFCEPPKAFGADTQTT
jgi:hypothetical protein